MEIKVIKIGVVNCWLRDKLRERSYPDEIISKIQKEIGNEMFFSPTPMWKTAADKLQKLPLYFKL